MTAQNAISGIEEFSARIIEEFRPLDNLHCGQVADFFNFFGVWESELA
ncbi:hypothetical protein CA267_014005 [Alteromonas pelagimontana]|uniref:Uncharacterized protein n=1 Tax=Alteromonas pelagimontana TaxID=1858656 RepID=A0A6M4MFD1_9ALTE|nr:hypothetical protein [Alteromonas pelagimontana]QJR81793.1 hypothetical protein CA267_014005 [Alteromonas pelagimontana]